MRRSPSLRPRSTAEPDATARARYSECLGNARGGVAIIARAKAFVLFGPTVTGVIPLPSLQK